MMEIKGKKIDDQGRQRAIFIYASIWTHTRNQGWAGVKP
jgi:hypothetical protein